MNSKLSLKQLEEKYTELTQKINQLENSDYQYRCLVDSTSDSLYLVDENCRYIFINSNHIKRLELSADQIIGRCYGEFHSEEQTSIFSERIKEVYLRNKSVFDEHYSPRDNGFFLRTFSPVRDSSNNKIAVAVVSKNITERKAIEEELRKSEEKYRLLIENSNEAVFIITNGKICFANIKTLQMLGYDKDELSSVSFINMVISEDRDMVLQRQESCLQQEDNASSVSYTFRVMDRKGTTRWVETNSVGINWDNQPALLNSMRDITGQKITEARLFQAQKMESIGTLAGGIAHDFNNLLMGIQGHTSLALLNLDLQDANYEHLKTIEALVMSGADLTKQLLGFARGGKFEVNNVDINSMIQKTSETIGRTKKEIQIHLNLQNNLWPVTADYGQIEQVLLNLYVNAWQAMPCCLINKCYRRNSILRKRCLIKDVTEAG